MLTPSQIKKLYPRAPQAHLDAFAASHQALFERFGLSEGRNRLHFFLAQIGHESGGLTITEENLNYSAPRLMAVWPSRFRTIAAATPFARNPERLANNVYASRMGNGDANSGDGWRYRGRGYAQITGRDGYASLAPIAGLDLVARPEFAASPTHALQVACAFWAWKKLSALADRGDFIGCTKRWNGGTIGMDDRWNWLAKVQQIVPWSVSAPAQETRRIDVDAVRHVQQVLRDAGLYRGSVDGIIGKMSRAALRAWQADRGLPVVGEITAETLASMPAMPAARPESAPAARAGAKSSAKAGKGPRHNGTRIGRKAPAASRPHVRH